MRTGSKDTLECCLQDSTVLKGRSAKNGGQLSKKLVAPKYTVLRFQYIDKNLSLSLSSGHPLQFNFLFTGNHAIKLGNASRGPSGL